MAGNKGKHKIVHVQRLKSCKQMPPKRTKPKSQICEGCGQSGAHYVVLDDRGLQAGVFLFCSNCTPKLKYRTGDYVVRWFRISSTLPPSRKPHRDIDLWTMPRWGDDDYVSPHEQHQSRKRPRRNSKSVLVVLEDDDDRNEDNEKQEGKQNHRLQEQKIQPITSTRQPNKKINFFAALSAAKDAGPRPAHIKPLKRMALEIAAKNTLTGNQTLGAFESLRLRLHQSLHKTFVDQLVESNRLSDYHARLKQEKLDALAEANKGDTLKEIESHAAKHDVEEHPEALHPAINPEEEEEENMDALSLALHATSQDTQKNWKQFSKHFLANLNTFVWEANPQTVDLSSCGLGPRDLDLLCNTVTKQTVGTLNLKWNLMGSPNSGFIHRILGQNCVHTLHLGWNKLGNDGVQVISNAFVRAKSLRDLDLTGNGITKEGIRYICNGIGKDTLLRRLNLSFNPIGAEGARELIDSGLGDAPLTHVGLRSCELGVHGAKCIAMGFRKNRNLKEMMLADNRVTPAGARLIARYLKLSPSALLRAFGVGKGSRSSEHDRDSNSS